MKKTNMSLFHMQFVYFGKSYGKNLALGLNLRFIGGWKRVA